MITFEYLNKVDFTSVSFVIFNILADNMSVIAPTGNSRDDDYKCWMENVSSGLLREERQIVLIKEADRIIGFFQYYTNTDTFMMEEIQFIPEYQSKGVFRKLYGFLIDNISDNIKFVEAFANKQNHKSIGILKRMGLLEIGTNKSGSCLHFRGSYNSLLNWYFS